jgi:hypothetical protein
MASSASWVLTRRRGAELPLEGVGLTSTDPAFFDGSSMPAQCPQRKPWTMLRWTQSSRAAAITGLGPADIVCCSRFRSGRDPLKLIRGRLGFRQTKMALRGLESALPSERLYSPMGEVLKGHLRRISVSWTYKC